MTIQTSKDTVKQMADLQEVINLYESFKSKGNINTPSLVDLYTINKISELTNKLTKTLDEIKAQEARMLNIISQEGVMKELEIGYLTLRRWERAGLPRYQAPIEDTRKVFYKISELLQFLGAQ